MPLPIESPLPLVPEDDERPVILHPAVYNLLVRKVRAVVNLRGVSNVRVVRSDAGYVIEPLTS